jgi:MtN3 and saliva related transmembrane protein
MYTEIIGYMAALIGTSIMIPQVYKSYKTKKVDDLSMVMLIIYVFNCILWEMYGLLIHSKPMIACNIVALIIAILQVIIKVRYRK